MLLAISAGLSFSYVSAAFGVGWLAVFLFSCVSATVFGVVDLSTLCISGFF